MLRRHGRLLSEFVERLDCPLCLWVVGIEAHTCMLPYRQPITASFLTLRCAHQRFLDLHRKYPPQVPMQLQSSVPSHAPGPSRLFGMAGSRTLAANNQKASAAPRPVVSSAFHVAACVPSENGREVGDRYQIGKDSLSLTSCSANSNRKCARCSVHNGRIHCPSALPIAPIKSLTPERAERQRAAVVML